MVTVQLSGGLPDPWIHTNIAHSEGSSYSYNPCVEGNGTFTIHTNANNSLLTGDNIPFINRELCGDFQITVRVQSINQGGYAGLMIREDNTPGSRMVGEYLNLNALLRWEARLTPNAPKIINQYSAPGAYWLRLRRFGNWIYGYYSYDGQNFFLVTAQNLPMASCLRVGMAAFSPISQPITAIFSNVTIEGGGVIPLISLPETEVEQAPVGREPMQVKLFPNPARDVVTLALSRTADPGSPEQVLPDGVAHSLSPGKSSEVRVRLLNQFGQLIEERRFDDNALRMEWDISNLQSGLYFMEVSPNGEPAQVVRFIKAE